MNCKTCNFSLVEGQTTCPVCGTPVEGITHNNEQNNNEGMKEVVLGSVENKPIFEETPEQITNEIVNNSVEFNSKENDVFGFNSAAPIVPEVPVQPEVIVEQPVMPEVPVQPEVMVEQPVMPEVPVQPEVMVEQPVVPEVPVQPEVMVEQPVVPEAPVQPEVMFNEQTSPEMNNQTAMNMFPNNENIVDNNSKPTQNVETQPAEPVLIAPEEVQNLENIIMPDKEPVPPVVNQIPTPVEQPKVEQGVNQMSIESPKPAKKGLGIVSMILIGLVVMVLAAAAGYFGYKKFFTVDQKATIDGYEYRISGKYKASIENNERILIYEKINKTDSAWVMTISGLDEEAKTFENVKTEKEAIKESIGADYIVEKMDVKNISSQDVLIYEVKKDEEVGYILYTPNKDNKPIKSEITFPKPPRSEKAIEILIDIANTAIKK